jgi:hypothetical protein
VSELVNRVSNLPEHASGTSGRSLVPRPEASLVPTGTGGTPSTSASRRQRGPGRLAVGVIAASLVAAVAVGAAVFGGGPTGRTIPAASTSTGLPAAGAAKGSLASSAADSASASSVGFTLSATESTPSSTSTLATATGALDLTKGMGQVTASLPSLSALTPGSESSLHLVADGTDLYVRIPALSSLTGGKSWVKTSASGLASLAGSATQLPLAALADPAQVMGLLDSVGGPVTKVGTVELHGESTTEYRTTVSISDIVSKATHDVTSSTASAGPSGALATALQDLGIPSVPVTAWVGSDGLLRQLSASVDLSHASLAGVLGSLSSGSGGPPAAGTSLDLTVGLSGYGQPVAVSIPPASEVTDVPDIGSTLRGMASKLGATLSTIASHV